MQQGREIYPVDAQRSGACNGKSQRDHERK